MKVLGISALYHDSAASILIDGEIIAAAQEERFTRVKQDASFPLNAIQFCLAEAEIQLNELDAVVFYDKPLLKFERLLETYFYYAPKGILSFVKSMPVWINEKMFFKKLLKESFKKLGELDWNKTKLLFPEHHLSHAASAFFPSRFDEAAILTIDGVGEWATVSISKGSGNNIKVLNNYGNLKQSLNDFKGAINLYTKALELNKNDINILFSLAGSYQSIGELENAKDVISKILILKPKNTSAHKMISGFTNYKENPEHLNVIEALLKNQDLSEDQKIDLHFALGKAYEDQKKYKIGI